MEFIEIIRILKQQKSYGKQVFVCGNGGSAATAEHFTNDLFSKEIKAICLNSNTSIMTMIANDFGYNHVFSKQLEIYAGLNDVVVIFSVSGISPNIIAIEKLDWLSKIRIYGREYEEIASAENRHLTLAHEIVRQL